MDIKDIQKQKQQQKDANRETEFRWDDMGAGSKQ